MKRNVLSDHCNNSCIGGLNPLFVLRYILVAMMFLVNNILIAQKEDPSIVGDFVVCGGSTHDYYVLNKPLNATLTWSVEPDTLVTTISINADNATIEWVANTSDTNYMGLISVKIKTLLYELTCSNPLKICPNTKIITDPTDLSVFEDLVNSCFKLGAVGNDRTFQWYVKKSGEDNYSIINQDIVPNFYIENTWLTNTLQLNTLLPEYKNYKYYCEVNSMCGDFRNSNIVTLLVYPVPTITTEPVDTYVCENVNAVFSVTATGAELSYQWYRIGENNTEIEIVNDTVYSGATTEALTITKTPYEFNNFVYLCKVSSAPNDTLSRTKSSGTATLTVRQIPAFNEQTAITVPATLCPNDTLVFGVEALMDVNYVWTLPTGWNTIGNGNNDTIQVKIGETTGIVTVYANSIYGCDSTKTIVTGSLQPLITTKITTEPADTYYADNDGEAQISFSANGVNLAYQWQVKSGSDWIDISTLTDPEPDYIITDSQLKCSKIYPNHSGYQYRCVVNGDCGSDTTQVVTLKQINDFTPYLETYNVTICSGTSITMMCKMLVDSNLEFDYRWYINDIISENNNDIVTLELSATSTFKVEIEHGGFVKASEPKTIYVNPKPVIKLLPETTAGYTQNQKGVFFFLDCKEDESAVWKPNNVTAYSDTLKDYLIVNFGKDNPIINVNLTNTFGCTAAQVYTLVLSQGCTALPETVNWKAKGKSILLFDQGNLGDTEQSFSWGQKEITTFSDSTLIQQTKQQYYDFYPDTINTSTHLYWIEPVNSCNTRYYYNTPMTVAENIPEQKKAIKLEIFPNPVSNHCIINPVSEAIVYPCIVSYYDIRGMITHRVQINDETQIPYSDDLSNLHRGLYILRLIDKNGQSASSKLILNN
ncbi:MAG: T9SS type A sorting domain-containing protein [Bacteroidales bacterium]|nr:T9SS type A sorting domain-containing protein [Bacteroidales bacterium]